MPNSENDSLRFPLSAIHDLSYTGKLVTFLISDTEGLLTRCLFRAASPEEARVIAEALFSSIASEAYGPFAIDFTPAPTRDGFNYTGYGTLTTDEGFATLAGRKRSSGMPLYMYLSGGAALYPLLAFVFWDILSSLQSPRREIASLLLPLLLLTGVAFALDYLLRVRTTYSLTINTIGIRELERNNCEITFLAPDEQETMQRSIIYAQTVDEAVQIEESLTNVLATIDELA